MMILTLPEEPILFFWKVLDVEAAQVDQIKKLVISKLDLSGLFFISAYSYIISCLNF